MQEVGGVKGYLTPMQWKGLGLHIFCSYSWFDVSREQLVYLSSLAFTWTEIAALLGVSRMTIYMEVKEVIVIIVV